MQRGAHVAAPAPPRHVVERHAAHGGGATAATGRVLRTLHGHRSYVPPHGRRTGPRNSPPRHPASTGRSLSRLAGVRETCVSMTGRRRTAPTLPRLRRRPRPPARVRRGALAACASLIAGCGVRARCRGGLRGRHDHRDDLGAARTPAPPTSPACRPSRRPTPAGSTHQGGLGGRKLKVLTCNEHNDRREPPPSAPDRGRRGERRRGRRLLQPVRRHLPARRWRAPASRTSAATASPARSSPARSPTRSTAASPRSLAGNGRQLAGPLRADRAGAARHASPATSCPALLDSGLSRAATDRRPGPAGAPRTPPSTTASRPAGAADATGDPDPAV